MTRRNNMRFNKLGVGILLFILSASPAFAQRWSEQKAAGWYQNVGWCAGVNFIPSTAVNQLEMWQADTYDPHTIEQELGWAANIGMSIIRVYLHHAVWKQDCAGFYKRVKDFLSIADRHQIKVVFVLFDDCWNETYTIGKQPIPKTGVHNSRWVKDPGKAWYDGASNLEDTLRGYVTGILKKFRRDKRIILWDLYNEPGWSGEMAKSLELSQKVFTWARAVNPTQPLTICVWNDVPEFKELNNLALAQSDVITYHNYQSVEKHLEQIKRLKAFGRPLVCTEYMARKHGSTFQTILPMLKAENVCAISWGLVAGKTNTIYAWDEPLSDGSEPKLWFHDIFRSDGTPYDSKEAELIKKLTKKSNE